MPRPKLPDAERRTHRVVVWLTEDEVATIDAKVAVQGLQGRGKQARADVLRQSILDDAPPPS